MQLLFHWFKWMLLHPLSPPLLLGQGVRLVLPLFSSPDVNSLRSVSPAAISCCDPMEFMDEVGSDHLTSLGNFSPIAVFLTVVSPGAFFKSKSSKGRPVVWERINCRQASLLIKNPSKRGGTHASCPPSGKLTHVISILHLLPLQSSEELSYFPKILQQKKSEASNLELFVQLLLKDNPRVG